MNKYFSRKFIAFISQMVGGILLILNFSDSTIVVITGAVVSFLSAVIYMFVEGKIDASRIGTALSDVVEIVDAIIKEKSDDKIQSESNPK